MLVKATLEDIERYGEFVYNIALDQSKSCYPTYTDGIKSKEDFFEDAKKSVISDTYEMLLFFHDSKMDGWIQYFWIEKDKYLQLCGCNINTATEQALTELLPLLAERFKGYEMYFGCSKTNVDATNFLKRNEFVCIEEDYNNSFFFDTYELQPESEYVASISEENYEDFRRIHSCMEEDTYWTCDRILAKMDSWKIYVYYENENPIGTIFFSGSKEYLEIFGVEFLAGKYSKEKFQALMVTVLNEGKRLGTKYLTFFCEEEQQAAVKELGFCYVGQYVCYMKTI